MGAFHAYDIRGIYNKDFNKDDAYKVGYHLVGLLKTQKVLVGRDVRTSSPEIFEYLCNGITDAGADVYNIGLATTPMVYFSTAKHGFNASVQITASHNSKEYNGMKVSRENALPVGYDTGLKEIEEKIKANAPMPKAAAKGKVIDYNVRDEYIKFLKQYVGDYSHLKIGIDCSNGMAALLIKDLLGDMPNYIFDELDGTFPNHEANPLVPENVVDLQNLVKEKGCDLGIIFDGDADRVMFVDENARFISPDLMIALLGHYFLEEKGQKGLVLQDIRTSKAVGEYLKPLGGEMRTWRVGRAFAAHKLREIDGIYGGELAGHYYFRDFYYSDSGLLACLIILNVISKFKKEGRTLSQLISGIETYANSGEINFRIENKKEAMDAVREHFVSVEKPTASFDFDGYRVEFPEWWFNIRPSNTEPYLRFIAEAKNKDLLNEKVSKVKEILQAF
ncbi:MAG TPA: phosphomannomutase/phosphoglucomutase [Tenuifilaceae bacterium]|nr:phosphomannomutase/phosphoglucomutase [Tenuifilaceae bacterium]HPE17287.1 phosphomannomutase/phosphoglucomutase [Tenuifilaceae bacterium]HPJ44513.1 phosphomannomutase/phosphoglucomutase [Tenuifilaceae bacterium]HPQ33051.1 phosphomannomutase/phosphoglucomutase [Tenuifilaceae bacterium]HRX67744.1 phosphomannomutase/phosphoglucomutase [Tenuifilaceae bacterium]